MFPQKIFLHCSDTKDSSTVSWDDIWRYHTGWAYNGNLISATEGQRLLREGKWVKKPWSDIGYHFGIELVEERYQILVGRMMNVQGAHARGHNGDSLGICFVGSFEDHPPPKAQWNLGIKLVRSLLDIFDIRWQDVYGHREVDSQKTCPGTKFDLVAFRGEL